MGWIHRIAWRIAVPSLLIVVLTVRLVWFAGHTTTGWETVADDCHAAAIGQFFGYRLPLPLKGVEAQADFWVAEIQRILNKAPHTPELLAGALWVLNSPCWDYGGLGGPRYFGMPGADVSRTIRWSNGPEFPKTAARRELQQKIVAEAAAKFPDAPNFWRTLAALPSSATTRRATLPMCQSHDPANALYDYLKAELDFPANTSGLTHFTEYGLQRISAAGRAAMEAENEKWMAATNEGLSDIEAGLNQPALEFPELRLSVIAILERARLSRQNKAWIGANLSDNSRLPSFQQRWLKIGFLANDRNFPNHETAARILRPLTLQFLDCGIPIPLPISGSGFERQVVSNISFFCERIVVGETIWPPSYRRDKSITDWVTEFRSKYNGAFSAIDKTWAASHPQAVRANDWIEFVPRQIMQLSVSLLLISAVGSFASILTRRWNGSVNASAPPPLGTLPQIACWLVALLLTVAVFGLSPGGVISQPVQSYVLSALFLALLTLLPLGVASWWKGRYSLRVLMELVFVYAVIFAGLVYWNLTTGAMKTFPPNIAVIPHDAGQMTADRVRDAIHASVGSLAWSVMQWVLYDGPLWTIALALLAIGWWTLDRAKRAWTQSNDRETSPKSRRYWLAWVVSRSVARAALGAAILALAVFLALEPERIAHFEAIYQDDYQRVYDPDAYWGELKRNQEKLINEMRADVAELLDKASPGENHAR